MKQVYYSELVNKLFDTPEACAEAEKQYQQEQEAKELQKKEEAKVASREKKELANLVEEANKKLDEAYSEYEIAKAKAKELLEASNKQILEILNPAKEKVKKAQDDMYKAVSNFNKRFGVYTATYSNDKILNELKRSTSWINDIFRGFFW